MKMLHEDLEDLIRSCPLLVVEFGDDVCGSCLAIRQKLEAWLSRHPEATERYLPIREFPALAAQRGILSAPTVNVWIDGQRVDQESGYFSLDLLLERVERALEFRKSS